MNTVQIVIYGIGCLVMGLILGKKIGEFLLAKKLHPMLDDLNTYVEKAIIEMDALKVSLEKGKKDAEE